MTQMATTKVPNTNLQLNQRHRRPLINRTPISENHEIKNISHPRVIERIIKPTITIKNQENLTKMDNLELSTTTTTTTTTIKPSTTKTVSITKQIVTENSIIEKLRNSGNIVQNMTEFQSNGPVFTSLNNSDEFREQQLNEKNSTEITTTMAPVLSAPVPIANNLDFYLDPINPEVNDDIVNPVNDVANLTEGYDSFLINENINAFTTGTTLCPKCKCGVRTLKKIVDGNVTAKNEYPWIVLLTFNQQFFCAGSLINDLYVVTAAHCTSTFQMDQITVNIQDIKKDNEKDFEVITRKVARVYRPLHFDQNTFFNDISLIKLSEPVDISNGMIRPICLPVDKTSFVGKIGSLTGWRLNVQNEISFHLTRMVNTTVLSNRQCRNTLVGKLIAPTMICSSSATPTIGTECRGDSGGPLMITQKGRSRLAGVVSWGLGCTRKNSADVFTRTTKFNGWLRKLSQGACWCN
ncbi:transmembrane protease serine 3-like [Condylostylus longicornis]|uniref:transmembrane protease serine 3-like n=1 Tax=Condylostylus longicornis TaxID=2530218 RepID=UPI00244DC899|nr:transmembrane protease serine 3-like [Condylostylus longicornis]